MQGEKGKKFPKIGETFRKKVEIKNIEWESRKKLKKINKRWLVDTVF